MNPGRRALSAFVIPLVLLAFVATPAPGLAAQDRTSTEGEAPSATDGAARSAAHGAAHNAPRIALQAGHWRAGEVPDELSRLRTNGTRWGDVMEWHVTLEIAERTATLLREQGYTVEILPATVPPGYRADLFISIHADGFHSSSASGFSVASPRRDRSGGRAAEFAGVLNRTYLQATQLRQRLPTWRMQRYYAFNTRRYRHAIDPATPGVIIETGFLTNPGDREIIVDAPERSARGIAAAVRDWLPMPVVAQGDRER